MKRILGLILAVIAVMVLTGDVTYASDDTEPKLIKMRATAYSIDGTTATGKETRKGICATGDSRYLGMTAVVYQRLPDGSIGDYIGIYEIEDTGCSEHVIDVWTPEAECQEFMDAVYKNDAAGKVWVQIMEADG